MNIQLPITPERFVDEYWQKKPLFSHQAIKDFDFTLTGDDLAGLSLEDNVRSRIISYTDNHPHWECDFGPFMESMYSSLAERNWTLLVQDVEKHIPELQKILELFTFLPRWRIEDLMISYAVDGGSVGPHTDNYDVFLIQAYGQRHWQIQTQNIKHVNLIPDIDMQILQEFESEQDWVVEPGDILYLPPGVAHHGVAQGECITLSVGFRAPSQLDLLYAFTDHVNATLEHGKFYQDELSLPVRHSGSITLHEIERMQSLLLDLVNDSDRFSDALLLHLSEPHESATLWSHETVSMDDFQSILNSATSLVLHPAARSYFSGTPPHELWYVNGIQHSVSRENSSIIQHLCDHYRLTPSQLKKLATAPSLLDIIYHLYLEGYIVVEN